MDDLDPDRMRWLVRRARYERNFPLGENVSPDELLEHLNLLNDGRLTNASVLLFGNAPQRHLISSEVRCAHFHGTQVAKPIASLQVYKGTVFDLVDQAVDFVLGKIARAVGTRAESVQVPVTYEIPKGGRDRSHCQRGGASGLYEQWQRAGDVVCRSARSLESRLAAASLTLEKLREPHNSIPGNPLIAESLYLAGYIERMGTGTLDMINRCIKAGLPEPEFAITDGFVARIWRKGPTDEAFAPRVGGKSESR